MIQALNDVIIIGSGPAGLTASIYCLRSQMKTLLLAGRAPGGQLMLTTLVENFPGFPNGVQGPELMQRMRDQSLGLGLEIVDKAVVKIEVEDGKYIVIDDEQNKYVTRAIILAMGAEHKWLGVSGESNLVGKGISTCAPCDAFFFKNKRVFVVGGGDSAMEEARVLSKFAKEVVVIHRRDTFRASKASINEVMKIPNVRKIMNSEIIKCIGDTKLSSLIISSNKITLDMQEYKDVFNDLNGKVINEGENTEWEVDTDGLFIAIGHKPNSEFVSEFLETHASGHVKSLRDGFINKIITLDKKEVPAEEYRFLLSTMTNREGIFVAGDLHDNQYKQAITAAGLGCMAAMDCDKWLSGQIAIT